MWPFLLTSIRILKVEYNLGINPKGGGLDFSKTFCKSIRNIQFNSRTTKKEIKIKSTNSDFVKPEKNSIFLKNDKTVIFYNNAGRKSGNFLDLG